MKYFLASVFLAVKNEVLSTDRVFVRIKRGNVCGFERLVGCPGARGGGGG